MVEASIASASIAKVGRSACRPIAFSIKPVRSIDSSPRNCPLMAKLSSFEASTSKWIGSALPNARVPPTTAVILRVDSKGASTCQEK